MKSKYLLPLGAALCSLFTAVNPLHAQGTGFTYQGRLTANGGPANGNYDLQFYLRDAATAGNPIGTTNTVTPVAVSNGLFTVTLDFGANFPGANRWLEIAVRTNGGGAYTTLLPRQALTASPYAITAGNVTAAQTLSSSALNLLNLNGANNGGTWLNLANSAAGGRSWSFIGTGPGNIEGAGKLLLRDNTANTVRTTWSTDGSVGIGTTTPGAPLEVQVAEGQSLQFRQDSAVPGINVKTTGNLAGIMRLRNAVEVWPSDDATRAGKVDVRNTAGNATISLDGQTGNASFRNLPGIRYSQSGGGAGTQYNNEVNVTPDSITINVPASGFVLVTASLNTGSSRSATEDFKLFQGSTELVKTTSNGLNSEHAIFWVIPVSAGSLSLHTILFRSADNDGNFGGTYFAHTLTAVYVPVQY